MNLNFALITAFSFAHSFTEKAVGVHCFSPPQISQSYSPRSSEVNNNLLSDISRQQRRLPSVFQHLYTSPKNSKNDDQDDSGGPGIFWRPEQLVASVLKSIWKGVTIPFPQLRGTFKRQADNTPTLAVGLRLRDCTLFLLSYFSVGVLAYSVLFEKWPILDALYFTSVCFSTVGYGDLCPTTAAGRMFTCFFGLAGIAFLGAAVATICSTLVSAEVEAAKTVERASKRRVLSLFRDMPKTLGKLRKSHGSDEVEQELQQKEEKKKRKRDKLISKTRPWLSVVKNSLPSLFIIIGGGAIMGYLNGTWSLLDSLYYSAITATTVGFGDLAPVTPKARLFAIFFIPISVGAAGELLSGVATALAKRRQRKAYETQFQDNLTIEHLNAMDTDGSGGVDREEYVYFMLKEMGLVSQDELEELFEQFNSLDANNSGIVDKEDLKVMAELKGAKVKE